MSQTKASQIIFSSLICGCLMHSSLGADETSPNEPYSIVPESRRKSEAEPVTTVQANRLNVRQIEGGGIGYGR